MTTQVERSPITLRELLDRPGVAEESVLRAKIGFCAYHGGNLERVTETIAKEAARISGASYFAITQPPGMRHHIPSTQVDPSHSRAFSEFINHCDFVITVHGYGRRKMFSSLLCGGGNRDLATHVTDHLRGSLSAYESIDNLDDIPPTLRGLHPDNPCNLTSGGGMQLELPPRVRGLTPLAHHWPTRDHLDTRFAHVNRLISALGEAASSWTTAPSIHPIPLSARGTIPDKGNHNHH